MKTPLRYQITEFDCGTVSLLNAVSYLYDREEIPSELIRAIYTYTLNCHNVKGIMNDKKMINDLCDWITKYSKNHDFNLECVHLVNEEVNYDNILSCIKNNGAVFIRCYQEDPHYVIITNINELNTYIFDPYYLEYDNYERDAEVRSVQSKPFEYNRIVRTSRVFSESMKDFSLGKVSKRECVLMNRK